MTDLVGSTGAVIDAESGDVAGLRYMPHGLPRGTSDHPDTSTDRLYTGQHTDGSGLMFYNARCHDPTIGRFAQPDTIVPNPQDPQYLYRAWLGQDDVAIDLLENLIELYEVQEGAYGGLWVVCPSGIQCRQSAVR